MRYYQSPTQNSLLEAFPPDELAQLSESLQLVQLALGDILQEPGEQLTRIHFPTTAIVSLVNVLQDGASVEIAVVGNEGMTGTALLMGGGTSPSRAIVQSAGFGFVLEARLLEEAFNRSPRVMELLLKYTQALITQMGQTAVCTRLHSLEQQVCKRLLLSLDRLPSNDVSVTQERIARLIGVRREAVTGAAGHLQRAGVIRYIRGSINVPDRTKLEKRVCECYAMVKKECDRLLPHSRKGHSQRPPVFDIVDMDQPSRT